MNCHRNYEATFALVVRLSASSSERPLQHGGFIPWHADSTVARYPAMPSDGSGLSHGRRDPLKLDFNEVYCLSLLIFAPPCEFCLILVVIGTTTRMKLSSQRPERVGFEYYDPLFF